MPKMKVNGAKAERVKKDTHVIELDRGPRTQTSTLE
jgi:hypothetical protein